MTADASEKISADLASLQMPGPQASIRIAKREAKRETKRETEDPVREGRRGGFLRPGLAMLAVLVAGAAVYRFAIPYFKSKILEPEVTTTEIALISPAQVSIQFSSTGYVVAQTVSKVGAKLPGRIAKLAVKQGDEVQAGAVLAEIETADVKATIASANSKVMAARAAAQTARVTAADAQQQAKRERALVEKGVSAEAKAQDLEAHAKALYAQVHAADAETAAAQAEVDRLMVNLGYLTITAPIKGTVMTKPADVGEIVGPLTAPVVELADFASLVVETNVPEARLQAIRIDGPAEIILDAYPEKRFRGRVTDRSPRIDRATATVTVKVGFVDAAAGVLPGMAGRISFLAAPLDEASTKEPARLTVPATAVTERGGAKVVFVLDGTKVRMTQLTLGGTFGTGIEIKAGATAGTRVVDNPGGDLSDGQTVKELH